MIQHQVNYDSGDRNVQPHRQGVARDPLVSLKVATLRAPHGDDHKGNDHNREEGVRVKNSEIDWPHNSLPAESSDAMMRVIDDIRDKKQYRSSQG